MLYLENVVLDAPYVEDVDDCELKVLSGSVENGTISELVSRPGIYQIVVELRGPPEQDAHGHTSTPLIAVCKAYAIQWNQVSDEIAELRAGWGCSDELDIDFKEALSEVNASLSELSKVFTNKARLRANSLGNAYRAEPNVWQARGPMGHDEEAGRLQNIALLDYILVSEENRGRGIGRRLVNGLMGKLRESYSTSHVLSFPTALNVNKMLYAGIGDENGEDAPRWYQAQQASIRFHREMGFRRLFGTKFFCFTFETEHAARKMTIAEDEMRDRFLGFQIS